MVTILEEKLSDSGDTRPSASFRTASPTELPSQMCDTNPSGCPEISGGQPILSVASSGSSPLHRSSNSVGSNHLISGRPNPNDVRRIIVMGPTGVGKSTLVNSISGSTLPVGHSLASCTQKLEVSSQFLLDNTLVELIDTPGFNDSVHSDMEILDEIVGGLESLRNDGKALHGVIYLHNISDYRMTGSARQNLRTFLELCGPTAMKNVAIVTNRWDSVPPEVGESREAELKNDERSFLPAIQSGAQWFRNDQPPESIQRVVYALMQLQPIHLDIQYELATCGSLLKTTAGASINRRMTEKITEHEDRLQKLNGEFETACKQLDSDAQEEIAQERDSAKRQLEELQFLARRLREQAQPIHGTERAPVSWMSPRKKIVKAFTHTRDWLLNDRNSTAIDPSGRQGDQGRQRNGSNDEPESAIGTLYHHGYV